ncbi:MAG: hypothetical protein WBQ95_03710 [Terracidiphilus sp.]
MRFPSRAALTFFLLPISSHPQTAKVNAPAPDFTATDSQGQTHSLGQYRGKYVVLE